MSRIVRGAIGFVLTLAVLGAAAVALLLHTYGRNLPDYTALAKYEPPITSRVYAGDGRLLAEYAFEKRIFVPIGVIPKRVLQAFLAAEDKNFYTHGGIDVVGVIRATWINFSNLGTDRRPMGASTITQQVAKNFLLSNEVSFERKIKEAMLAFRIDRAFSKDRILELYLNQIYLGRGSYGVAAAALNYFNKGLDELSLPEVALLAALPKGPSLYDPVRNPAAAESRRNWVIGRMLEDGYVTEEQANGARATPLSTRQRETTELVTADYFAEEVRRELIGRYGEAALYQGGLAVHATVDPRLQSIADEALRRGLQAYDRRHGWRGPLATINSAAGGGARLPADWLDRLSETPRPPGLGSWRMAAVLQLDSKGADIGLADGRTGRIPLEELKWARRDSKGPPVRLPSDVLAAGDVIAVEPLEARDKGGFGLRQIPEIEGALVALDPHTGRVLAMTGGYSYELSQFNRATQAMRQPGSAFKPIVYLAALEAGYTPSTIILDAPMVVDQGPGRPPWTPSNFSERFYGPTTMRVGIEQSRNVMTVRLAEAIGMNRVADAAKRFGLFNDMPRLLAYALGAGETTLLRLTTAYGMLVNGGKRITPTLIDQVQDRYGRTVYRHDTRPCPECQGVDWHSQAVPDIPDTREPVTDPQSAYQIVSMLEGVVERGTGRRIGSIGKLLAGKTGTSNESRDTWFVGFAPDLAVGVFVGFDEPKSLGGDEAAASVSAPIFRDFMQAALKTVPAISFRIPPDVRLVRIEAGSGHLAQPGDRNVVLEAFKPGTEPTFERDIAPSLDAPVMGPSGGTGGLY